MSGGLEYPVKFSGRRSGLSVWYHVRRVVLDYVSQNYTSVPVQDVEQEARGSGKDMNQDAEI